MPGISGPNDRCPAGGSSDGLLQHVVCIFAYTGRAEGQKVWRDDDRDILYPHRRREIEDVFDRVVADGHAPDCNRLAVDHDVSAEIRAPVRFRTRPVRCVWPLSLSCSYV